MFKISQSDSLHDRMFDNLRSGVPYIFCRGGKVRLIQLLDYLSVAIQNLDFSLIGQETKGYLELSHDWLPLWRYDFR